MCVCGVEWHTSRFGSGQVAASCYRMSDRHLNLGDTALTSHTTPNLSHCVLLCACMVRADRAQLLPVLAVQQDGPGQAQAQGVTRVSVQTKRLGNRPCRLASGRQQHRICTGASIGLIAAQCRRRRQSSMAGHTPSHKWLSGRTDES